MLWRERKMGMRCCKNHGDGGVARRLIGWLLRWLSRGLSRRLLELGHVLCGVGVKRRWYVYCCGWVSSCNSIEVEVALEGGSKADWLISSMVE